MISKWFSDTMTPWNYGVSILIVLTVLFIDQIIGGDTSFWHIQDRLARPLTFQLVGIFGLTLILWSYLDQHILRNLRQGSSYSLLFPTLVIWMFSTHLHELSLGMLIVHGLIILFLSLWIIFQHNKTKITLFGSGLSVGFLVLQYPVLGFLVGFGLSSIWIWNHSPLRNSLIWLLGCLLPVYYWVAYHYISFQRLPEMPQLNRPEIWLINLPDGDIPWHLILLFGAAILGFFVQLPWFASQSRTLRLLNLQWIGLMLFLVPVMLVMRGDPWLLLALLSPWGAWHTSAFLEWNDGAWVQDLFFVSWIVLVLWGS